MAKEKIEFNYGDLAIYSQTLDFSSNKFASSYGRIYGKVDNAVAMSTYGIHCKTGEDLYVFSPKGVLDSVIEDAIKLFGGFSKDKHYDKIVFEFGEFPNNKHWIFADTADLQHAITEDDKVKFKHVGLCPECGSSGYWKNLALICEFHGRFI